MNDDVGIGNLAKICTASTDLLRGFSVDDVIVAGLMIMMWHSVALMWHCALHSFTAAVYIHFQWVIRPLKLDR